MRSTDRRAREFGLLGILLTGQAMATMDGSILVIAAPSLRANLHASGAELQLVVAAYTLAFAVLVVTAARVGDMVEAPRAFVQGLAAFTLGSLAAGLAPTPEVLIVARGFQGAAAALMTAQVLSIIQRRFRGERRARAIGAYSMILAVGVAAGQIVGGLLVGVNLVSASWRAALLINVPVGAVLLVCARGRLPEMAAGDRHRLDLGGVGLLSAALLALLVPLSFGRDYGWPLWVWPCFAGCVLASWGFTAHERRLQGGDRTPLFDLDLLQRPRVRSGVVAVLLGMSSYAGFVLSITLYLQDGLGFSPLHAGAIFAIYASGFAAASLTWTRVVPAFRERLPVIGPLVMGAAILAVGMITIGGGWPLALTAPLVFGGGMGHACAFSPLANRLTTLVKPTQASNLSGLLLTADFIGMAFGVAAFTGIYLSAAPHGAGRALALASAATATALAATAVCAQHALAPETGVRTTERRLISRH
jgi:predicted MFS family arabinose efflux permease